MDAREIYKALYTELEGYENCGVKMKLEDHPASPMQIVQAHMIEEDNVYMRDYVWDEQGAVKEIAFHNITNS